MAIEKNAVVGDAHQKTASKDSRVRCPICGLRADTEGSLPRCPRHGTAPWEKREDID